MITSQNEPKQVTGKVLRAFYSVEIVDKKPVRTKVVPGKSFTCDEIQMAELISAGKVEDPAKSKSKVDVADKK